MIVSEPYVFVLMISSALCIPLALAVKTLLATKQYVILPILRLRVMDGHTRAFVRKSSHPIGEPTSSIQSGGHHGNGRSVDGEELGED